MVESDDTDKPTKSAVCETCGKSIGASVSGSDDSWNFKPVCRCSISASAGRVNADEKPGADGYEKNEKQSTSEQIPNQKEETDNAASSTEQNPEHNKDGSDVGASSKPVSTDKQSPDQKIGSELESEPTNEPKTTAPGSDRDVHHGTALESEPIDEPKPKAEPGLDSINHSEVRDDDSGGWASVTSVRSAKISNGPDFSQTPKSAAGSANWNTASSPKSFRGNATHSGDSHESWISLGGSDFAGPPADDFNRPVAHEIGKVSSTAATSGSASSSGTNLGVSYSSGTNLSGAGSSGAFARGTASKKVEEEPADWVPVKKKPPEASKSQFADDTELLDLTHKSETPAEERVRPSTRKSIQEAFRRNRIKTIIVAVVALVMAYGVYSYASTKGLIKKIGILNQSSKSSQQSKKGSSRQSKKNKRVK